MRKNFWYFVIFLLAALTGGAAVMYGLQSVPSFATTMCSVKTNRNTEVPPLTETFQAQGITFMYPKNLTLLSISAENGSTTVGELESTEQATITDPLSKQDVTESLIRLAISKEPNAENLSLPDFINAKSETANEKVRTRDDRDGNIGIRQWIWFQGNPITDSYHTYYIQTGTGIWQIRAEIFDPNPDSATYLKASQTVSDIFDSVKLE
ncbi:MAG: hypothetical protein WC497_02520 [Patescibacteria group bacterium]